MRVTNQTVLRNSISRLQQNLQSVERAREDIASGLRLRRMSQDPTAGSEVMRVGGSMRAIEQFRRNIRIGVARVDTEERALDSLTNTLSRAMELAISQSSSTATADTRTAVKAEVDALINFAVGLGNTRFGDDYLFAGTRGGEAPFQNPPTAAGDFRRLQDTGGNLVDPSGTIPLEIGDGRFMVPNHNGTEVFLDTNALASLRQLSEALGANDVPGIAASIDSLRGAVSDVQTLIGRQGARANDLSAADLALGDLELTLQAFRSELRDTEVDKAMVELVGRQTMYQAAMSATSRVLGLSLANYL
jgi:flagellar hook-associated protein 3 FlgL